VLLSRGGAVFEIHLVRMRRARRYVMRVRPDGSLRVTVPRGGSRAEALRFAGRHLRWAEAERARLASLPRLPAAWNDGAVVLLDGVAVCVHRERHGDVDVVSMGRISATVPAGTGDVRGALERAMRETARQELPPLLLDHARAQRLEVARITIRSQRSRWGSCSRRGAIALNFRLIQMPPEVREYIVLHELMHLKQANHSRRFWALVERVCPAFRAAEQWLKTHGPGLF
jgi:predicted metal-dependent hydrolase